MPSETSTSSIDEGLARRVEELERQLSEAHRRETATAEVLKIISRSPFDLQGGLDALVTSAARLCEADIVSIRRREGEAYPRVASHGLSSEQANFGERLPEHYGRGTISGRTILEMKTVHIPDVLADPEFTWHENSRVLGWQTGLSVPLLRDGRLIGLVNLLRLKQRPFTDKQIELAETFADQAVIAIENTRLFEEVQEALAHQKATTEVLDVISRSPTSTQPVFDAIIASAAKLCNAAFSAIELYDGKDLQYIASHNFTPEVEAKLRAKDGRYALDPRRLAHRAILMRAPVHTADVQLDPDYPVELARSGQWRALLSMPMLQQGEAVGVISVSRPEPVPFTERQIALLKVFADQAVIAIENTRLFQEVQARTAELTESLEHQTATGAILRAIAASPTDIRPVLQVVVETAKRLCDAYDVALMLREGDLLRLGAHYGPIPIDFEKQQIGRGWVTGRAVVDAATIHVPDLAAEANEFPVGQALAMRLGHRTTLCVPLLRRGSAIGALILRRIEVRPFSEKEIALVETFADQAVIAIENTRLFEEVQARTRDLADALKHQTATSEVLSVISRSKFDLQPVLDTLVQSAVQLCEADVAVIRRRQGETFSVAATHGLSREQREHLESYPRNVDHGSIYGRAILEGRTVHVPDVLADPEFKRLEQTRVTGIRANVSVPLMREGIIVGTLTVIRRQPRAFHPKQIELLETFADQAVVAIENTRLFEEIAQKSRELEIASQHKSQFVANMSHELRTPLAAILGYAELMQEGFYGAPSEKSMDALTRIRANGKHLLGLINTVLDIAKIESGQFSLNLSEYAVENVVETVRAATESLAETKKIALKTDVTKRLPIGLGDEQRLTQVLLNLVGNAIKFTDTGEVRITATAMNGHFTVAVTDTGPGIPAEELKRVFEQFHQIDNSNTKAKGGTGLGLAIAKQIVEMHGGRIWVESTLGKGATFRMELPVRAETRKAAE